VAEIKVDHAQTLAKVQIFSGLTESELAFLAQRAVPRRFSPGEPFSARGDPALVSMWLSPGTSASSKVPLLDVNRFSVSMGQAAPSQSSRSSMEETTRPL
jgi:hypothetical protein